MARRAGVLSRSLCSFALLLSFSSATARADGGEAEPELGPATVLEPADGPRLTHPPLHIEPSAWSGISAFIPGFVLPGAGAFVAGDRRAAKHIAIARTGGFATLFVSGAIIASTGTSRRLIGTFAPLAIMGTGTFLVGWLADIYAATTGGREAHALNWVPALEAELGYRYVHDPQFAYRTFSYVGVDLRGGRFRASPSAWLALDDNNQRVALELAGRLWGRTLRRPSADASYLDATTAVTYHNYASESFAVWTNEWRLDGRLDLARFGQSLSGSFVEGHVGAGLEFYDFDASTARPRADAFGLLLARFGFGVYFGDGVARTGELLVYYDHRHDDYAAGMAVRGIGGGILGHIGASGHYFLTKSWGLSLMGELGSAYIAGMSVRYRLGRLAREG